MLVTKEQQERLLLNYIKENHTQDECIGFVDGINATLELLLRIDKDNKNAYSEMQNTGCRD